MRTWALAAAAAAIVLLSAGCDGNGGNTGQRKVSVSETQDKGEQAAEKETEASTDSGTAAESGAASENKTLAPGAATTAEHASETRERFSYLAQLSPEKQEAYKAFEQSRDLGLLTNFSPEEMVLAYFHTISNGDPYALHPMIYNGGYLADLARFTDEYFKYVGNHHSETALHYRYYDSIKVDELNSKPDYKAVVTSVSVGIHYHSMLRGLRKEDGVWKLDVYGSMKNQIKAGKEAELETKK
ncbi:hypothetical protein [Paenibacillus methanolicus]|uniref:SnoaL-like protein n=1 Tax=Paenibacillus methanolicus TaxID=582686 RepID=A0A5S5C7X7_9BACL|nr:hypothetical protein [Paenibacillus methanolicus]TYP74708.1 hypothetical protein BCM02_105252 [Paenibacillus methanolicus]